MRRIRTGVKVVLYEEAHILCGEALTLRKSGFDCQSRGKLPVPESHYENNLVKKLGGSLLGIRGQFEGPKVLWVNKYTKEEIKIEDWSTFHPSPRFARTAGSKDLRNPNYTLSDGWHSNRYNSHGYSKLRRNNKLISEINMLNGIVQERKVPQSLRQITARC